MSAIDTTYQDTLLQRSLLLSYEDTDPPCQLFLLVFVH